MTKTDQITFFRFTHRLLSQQLIYTIWVDRFICKIHKLSHTNNAPLKDHETLSLDPEHWSCRDKHVNRVLGAGWSNRWGDGAGGGVGGRSHRGRGRLCSTGRRVRLVCPELFRVVGYRIIRCIDIVYSWMIYRYY